MIDATRKGDLVFVRITTKGGKGLVGKLTPAEARALAARLLIASDEEAEGIFRVAEKGIEAARILQEMAGRLRLL